MWFAWCRIQGYTEKDGLIRECQMKEIDIDEARTNLFLLVDQAVCGEPFFIMRSGRALVKVEAVPGVILERLPRLGFMAGRFSIPEDFDALDPQIEKLFYGEK